ncbi:hypothetical protein Bca4012_058474 [Brassica carinata]|uniref:Uncharacterized protein n=1 Tax=Brassica carinata TaxID=52824 RepID=A0A8X7W6L7_BRACI|nr:hypothetical protein Bca52824_016221 [Brassica carinata]
MDKASVTTISKVKCLILSKKMFRKKLQGKGGEKNNVGGGGGGGGGGSDSSESLGSLKMTRRPSVS